MSSKLDDTTKRWNMVAPISWFELIENWRRLQPMPIPSVSEAIRRLVELGLEPAAKPRKPKTGRKSKPQQDRLAL